MDNEKFQETLKKVIEKLAGSIDEYDYYQRFLFDGKEIMMIVFRDYLDVVEGSTYCADKARFIVKRIEKALEERKNQSLIETYQEYKDRGGNIGEITELDKVCYWCPTTIKDTTTAITLYYSLLNVPRYVQKYNKYLKMWKELKEFIKTYQDDISWKNKQIDEFQEELLDKMQELEGENG